MFVQIIFHLFSGFLQFGRPYFTQGNGSCGESFLFQQQQQQSVSLQVFKIFIEQRNEQTFESSTLSLRIAVTWNAEE